MLNWSPGAIRATVGVGGLAFLIYMSTLDTLLQTNAGYGPIFVTAFLPAFIFFFATPDLLPASIARAAQWVAIGWYLLVVIVSLGVIVSRGVMGIDAMLVPFMLIGAWPCLFAARKLWAVSED